MAVFRYLLHNQGFKVLGAATGCDALLSSDGSGDRIDLIICDLGLPDMSGTNVANELLRSHPEAAVLLLSGTPLAGWSRSDLDNFRQLPPKRTDFLEKPFLPSD